MRRLSRGALVLRKEIFQIVNDAFADEVAIGFDKLRRLSDVLALVIAATADERLERIHVKMLLKIGLFAILHGSISERRLADAMGIRRKYVSSAVETLMQHGYLTEQVTRL